MTAASKVTANKADVRNSLHLEEPRIRSLSSVLEEQQSLSTYLNTLMGKFVVCVHVFMCVCACVRVCVCVCVCMCMCVCVQNCCG